METAEQRDQMEQHSAVVTSLYKDASPQLIRVLQRKLGNRSDAEEVAQDAFEKLLEVIQHKEQEIEDLHRYFFTLANHMAIDRLRRRQIQYQYEQTNLLAELDFESGGPEQITQAQEQINQARQALAALPEKTRHVFLLVRFEGLTHAEVSARLGLSKKAIEYHMRQGLTAIVERVKASAT